MATGSRRPRGRRAGVRALAAVAWTTLAAGLAAAQGTDADALAPRAELIVRATCTGASARWDPAQRLVVTDVTLAVDEVVAGRAPATLRLAEPGGVLPERNFGMLVPHAARFVPGEESVLLLARDAGGRLRVLGGVRGQMRVVRDRARGAPTVGGADWSAVRARLAAGAARGTGRR